MGKVERKSLCVGGGGEGNTGDWGRGRCITLQRQQFELGRQNSIISRKVAIDLPCNQKKKFHLEIKSISNQSKTYRKRDNFRSIRHRFFDLVLRTQQILSFV